MLSLFFINRYSRYKVMNPFVPPTNNEMQKYHYFFQLEQQDILLKHDRCMSMKHEIFYFKIMPDYIIHEYNHPRSKFKLKLIAKRPFNIEEPTIAPNYGVDNWTNERDESYGLYTVDKSENVVPLPIKYDENINLLEIKLTAPTSVYFIDMISTCKFDIMQRSKVFPFDWYDTSVGTATTTSDIN